MADTWGPFLNGLSYLESNQNPLARNPKSTATGAFQFLNGTARDASNMGIQNTQTGSYADQSAATQAFIRKVNPRAAAAIDKGDYPGAIPLLRNTWPSLPGGSQPQTDARYQKFHSLLGFAPGGPAPAPDTSGGGGQETAQGGPGQDTLKLLNQGQQPYNPMTSDWGSALQGAGAALAASSNPQAAAVLASQQRDSRNNLMEQYKLQQNDHEIKVLDDGTVLRISKSDGRATPLYQGREPLMSEPHQNMFGEKWSTFRGKFSGKQVGGIEGDAPMLSDKLFQDIQDARAAGKSIPEMIQMAPPQMRGYVRALVNGDEPPGGLGMGSKIAGPGMALAQTIANVDVGVFAERKKLRQEFASNAPSSVGGTMRSGGTLARHVAEGPDVYAALGNTPLPIWNSIKNRFESETGSPAQNRFATWANTYANEAARYMGGKAPSDEARNEINSTFQQRLSPDAFKAAIARHAQMFDDKHKEYAENWKAIMSDPTGQTFPFKGTGLWSPEAQKDIDSVKALDVVPKSTMAPNNNPGNPVTAAPGATGAPPIVTKMIWDANQNKYVPVQPNKVGPGGA